MSSPTILKRIKQIIDIIYSREGSADIVNAIRNLMDSYGRSRTIVNKIKLYFDRAIVDEKDAFLITYPDTLYNQGEKPLRTLYRFLNKYVHKTVSGVHILPFHPSSSDAGFSVIDLRAVDPRLGSWDDIQEIAGDFRLMVDLVMNHVSSKSHWFQKFLQGDKRYRDYFIWANNAVKLPKVFRPRDLPLFTRFDTAMGTKYLWTTFGPDQIDLNYKNPAVLLEIIELLFFYLTQGAEVIRLDAVGYVWKEPNSSCVNLPKTHQLVKLLRAVLEYTAPYALILTEANFPYKDNVAYFGEGHESNMVYDFALPPLVIDAFARQDTSYIRESTTRTRPDLLFFEFLASHDGIGLLSAKKLLSRKDFNNLLGLIKAHNGLISYERTHGEREPYELNISYLDALNDPNRDVDHLALKRFIASQAIMLALKGVPGIYIHSFLGVAKLLPRRQKIGGAADDQSGTSPPAGYRDSIIQRNIDSKPGDARFSGIVKYKRKDMRVSPRQRQNGN